MKKLMSTIILLIIILINTNAQGQNTKGKIYNNIENNKYRCVKEFTTIDNETSQVIKKVIYLYNAEGILQGKTLYRWDNKQGWIGTQKYEYEYNSEKLENLIYTEWDNNTTTWSAKAQHLIHIYNVEGELLAVKQIQVNNDYRLIAKNELQSFTYNK